MAAANEMDHGRQTEIEIVSLPPDAQILHESIKESIVNILSKVPLSQNSEWFHKTLKYTVPSLSNGRFLNQVNIVAAGQIGMHKREILSCLLGDKISRCPCVSSSGVGYNSNNLYVDDGHCKVEFKLKVDFIDLCTGSEHAGHSDATSHMFVASENFTPRRAVRDNIPPELQNLVENCRPTEYPNLVLYFASTENFQTSSNKKNGNDEQTNDKNDQNEQTVGNAKDDSKKGKKTTGKKQKTKRESIISYQLTQLHKMNLIDTTANNLILIIDKSETPEVIKMVESPEVPTSVDSPDAQTSVEAPHGSQQQPPQGSMSTKKSDGEIQGDVVKQFREIYGAVGEVPVVILNNLKGSKNSEQTQMELRDDILKFAAEMFIKHKDYLGLLLLKKVMEDEQESDDLNKAQLFSEIRDFLGRDTVAADYDGKTLFDFLGENPVLKQGFHSIGQAYCPVTETLKMHNVFGQHKNGRQVTVGQTQFSLPHFIKLYLDMSTESWSLSHSSKKAYEANRKFNYGLEKGVTLQVEACSRGHWNTDLVSKSSSKSELVLHEVRIAFLQVLNPEEHMSSEIKAELGSLPWSESDPEYLKLIPQNMTPNKKQLDKLKSDRYNAFFAKWGTHFVCKQWLGGYIKTDWTKERSSNAKESNVWAALKARIFNRDGGNTGGKMSSKCNLFSVKRGEKLSITGHEHDDLMYLEFDKITPELYYGWVTQVKRNPNALNYSFLLYPYYNSSHCKNKAELRERTLHYLANKAKSERACFPASTTVRLKNGREKSISQLIPFDPIQTVRRSKGRSVVSYTPHLTYLHREPSKKAVFLKLCFSNGKSLQVTPNHLLFVVESNNNGSGIKGKQAAQVKIGERSLYVDENGAVKIAALVEFHIVEDYGVFCPLTSAGCFVADGFFVTCYASVSSFAIAHASMAPLRFWYRCKSAVKANAVRAQQDSQQGIHDYAKLLIAIRSIFLININLHSVL